MLAVLLIIAAQPLDPVERYEQRFEQKTTPPLYAPQPRASPPVNFNHPFGNGITPQPKERRYIGPDGKLVTCRNAGPWVYCF